jgi:acyl dehydratase
MITIATLAELRALAGRELGVSDWLVVSQDRIAAFAAATDDRQWIHVDVERARDEGPFGTTIAHGFLTLALLSPLLRSAVSIDGVRMAINYGLDRVRFVAPVPSGARVRARIALAKIVEPAGPPAAQATWSITVERDGESKPCVVAEWLVRYYS